MTKGRPKLNGSRKFKLEVFQLLPKTGEEIEYSIWKKAALDKGIKHTTFLKNVRKLTIENMIDRRKVYFKKGEGKIKGKNRMPKVFYFVKNPAINQFADEMLKRLVKSKDLDLSGTKEMNSEQYSLVINYYIDRILLCFGVYISQDFAEALSFLDEKISLNFLENLIELYVFPYLRENFLTLKKILEINPDKISKDDVRLMIKNKIIEKQNIDNKEFEMLVLKSRDLEKAKNIRKS